MTDEQLQIDGTKLTPKERSLVDHVVAKTASIKDKQLHKLAIDYNALLNTEKDLCQARIEALIEEIDAQLKLYVCLYVQEPQTYIKIPINEWAAIKGKLKATHITQ